MPDEAIRGDRAAHVVGDLPRLVERAADQQQAELVAAEAGDRIRVANRFAQQLRDFAQHAVPGEMTAGVVDDLEAIEIEVTQHVRRVATSRAFDRFIEAALELAPVHEARQGIVRRLVRHLPMQAAQLGDVVHEDDRASELTAFILQWRCGELDGALLPRGLAEQHGPAAQIVRVAIAAADRFLDRLGELLAIVLVDEADDVLEQPADGLRAQHAEKFLGCRVQVREPPFDVGGDDGFAERLHGEDLQRRGHGRRRRKRRSHHRGARGGFFLVELAAGERAQFLRRDDFHAGHQQRGRAFEIDLRGS